LSHPLAVLIVKNILQDGVSEKCCRYKHTLPYLKNVDKEMKEQKMKNNIKNMKFPCSSPITNIFFPPQAGTL
jgi:hypothetical protein